MYDRSVGGGLFTDTEQNGSVTRGHEKRMCKPRPRLDMRKYSFSDRVVNSWNSLPYSVVNVASVIENERKLDRVSI